MARSRALVQAQHILPTLAVLANFVVSILLLLKKKKVKKVKFNSSEPCRAIHL